MKINSTADKISRIIHHSDNALQNAQLKIATGLQNPDPATNPAASTVAKTMNFTALDAKKIASNAAVAKNTAEIAWSNLQALQKTYEKMKTLSVQAANSTNSDQNRSLMNQELQSYITLADNNANAKWLGESLSDGSFMMKCQISQNFSAINSIMGSAITSPLPLLAGDLTINGVDIGAVSSGTTTDIANAINAVIGQTGGISASSLTKAVGSSFTQPYASLIGNINITYNGNTTPVSVGPFFGSETVDQAVNMAVSAINTAFSGTNLSASNVNSKLEIQTTDGNSLGISYFNLYAENVAGPSSSSYYSQIELSDYGSISIGGNAPNKAGFTSQVTVNPGSGILTMSLKDMRSQTLFGSSAPNLLTISGAQTALGQIDNALQAITSEIARVSFFSIEFQNTQENMDEFALQSKFNVSTIEDADFTSTIAESERLTIMQEAASAILKDSFKMERDLANLVEESLG